MLKCGVCGSWHKNKNALGVHRSTKHRARALVKAEANGHLKNALKDEIDIINLKIGALNGRRERLETVLAELR